MAARLVEFQASPPAARAAAAPASDSADDDSDSDEATRVSLMTPPVASRLLVGRWTSDRAIIIIASAALCCPSSTSALLQPPMRRPAVCRAADGANASRLHPPAAATTPARSIRPSTGLCVAMLNSDDGKRIERLRLVNGTSTSMEALLVSR
ncbi:hypothetical protein CAOG_009938 [Capsaspora owczarzaki ATCC 30864]|uniref:Uncharacterized protein n=1 Tax=Capsaspora owczarzaki (strain ATCC 30864) TaxID=595528 RepID=A0A0D2WT79_CAPO3|nr:hypothetical protein CAOG_009938 [Capsaspora owczarzaki ATCC 30864]